MAGTRLPRQACVDYRLRTVMPTNDVPVGKPYWHVPEQHLRIEDALAGDSPPCSHRTTET